MQIMKIDLASIFFDRNCPLRTPLEIAFQSIRRPFVACALAARVSRSWKVEPSAKLGDLRDKVKRMRTYMKNEVNVHCQSFSFRTSTPFWTHRLQFNGRTKIVKLNISHPTKKAATWFRN